MRHTMHLRPGVAKQPNLELKTRPKQLLGSLPLVIVLPGNCDCHAEQKILFTNETKQTEFWPRPKD